MEKALATHSSTLAWKIPWMEEPGRLQSMGLLRVRYNWATSLSLNFHALEKEMATHSSVLAWRIPGTGEPDGLPSMGSHGVRHDWCDLAAAAMYLCSLKLSAYVFMVITASWWVDPFIITQWPSLLQFGLKVRFVRYKNNPPFPVSTCMKSFWAYIRPWSWRVSCRQPMFGSSFSFFNY